MATRSVQTRLQAQARELTIKAREAHRAGDQNLWVRLQKKWAELMRQALSENPTFSR